MYSVGPVIVIVYWAMYEQARRGVVYVTYYRIYVVYD